MTVAFDPKLHDVTTCTRETCRRCSPQGRSSAPEIPHNPHEAQAPIGPPDGAVRSIGLASHPSPGNLAEDLRATAQSLYEQGTRAVDMIAVLAARGWAASTLGDGGSRGTDATSSPEREALVDFHNPWVGADVSFAQDLHDLAKLHTKVNNKIAAALRHAQDLDPVPVGTGECQACGRFCRPNKTHPGNRLRAGLCPTDYRAMHRANPDSRTDWVRTRRNALTDPNGVLHTPEPDHDIDLTSELLSPEG
jgi:hypothetical protein